MLRITTWLLLAFAIPVHGVAPFHAVQNAVYEAVHEQHAVTIQGASKQLAAERLGLSYDFYIRPSLRVRTNTDPLPRVRAGAGVNIAPDNIAIARALLTVARSEFALWEASVRAVESELLLHLDAHLAEQAVAIAEHQVRTQQENLRQLVTSDDYEPALVAAAEIAVRAAERDTEVAHEAALRFQRALLTPGQTIFDQADVFSWRFSITPPPLTEHPHLVVLRAQVAVAERTLLDAQLRSLHKLEAAVTWEDGPLNAGAAIRLQRSMLGGSVAGEYDTAGTQARVTLEVSGDFRFDQSMPERTRTAKAAHEQALEAMNAFLTTQPGVIVQQGRAFMRAEEALDDALLTLALAEEALRNATEREAVRSQNEVDRAHTALHRSWRQYLRATRDYLEATGGVFQLR